MLIPVSIYAAPLSGLIVEMSQLIETGMSVSPLSLPGGGVCRVWSAKSR